MSVAKEQIRQIIADNNLSSVADVYSLLRDSFKDILQELMEAELDASLGYEKNQKDNTVSSNKRAVWKFFCKYVNIRGSSMIKSKS